MNGKGNQLDEFVKLIKQAGKDHIKVQTAWVNVQEVDWESLTMTAIGVSDELPYYGVSLGLGMIKVKPAIGSTCLIGVIENQAASTFLIDAETVEEYTISVTDKVSIRNETESLKDLVEELIEEIKKMKFTTNAGPTIRLLNSARFTTIKNKFNNLLK